MLNQPGQRKNPSTKAINVLVSIWRGLSLVLALNALDLVEELVRLLSDRYICVETLMILIFGIR